MSYTLNKKLSGLKPYDPIQGDFRIRLDANESFYNNNPVLSEKIACEIGNINLNRYPDPYAAEVTHAFSELYGIPEKYVTAGNGSDELISILTSCFLKTGDTILTLSPDFSMYAFYGSLFELQVSTLEKEPDLSINVDKVIAYCNTHSVNALIFSNPCNPTSLGLTREDVIHLVSGVECLVILDEAYMDFWSESLLDAIAEFDNLIILRTCSKAVGLAAIRLGFAVAGETITNALRAAKSPYNTDTVSQTIGKCVLEEKALLSENRKEIIQSRDSLYAMLVKLSEKYPAFEKIYESKTNFVLIRTPNAEEIFSALLKESIAIRKMGTYLRITAGTEQENTTLTAALEKILQAI